MDLQKIKGHMMSLWKETFRDSYEYVNLIFSNYFDPDYIACFEEDGGLKSSLLGIPYDFISSGSTLRGLYLCGLSTKKECRRRGLMSLLLEQINLKAREKGFDFTFLIPSGEGVKRFYRDRGYNDSFFIKKEYYVRGHDFQSDIEVTLSRYGASFAPQEPASDFEGLKKADERVSDFLKSFGNTVYKKANAYLLQHSEKDWNIVLEESLISEDPVFIAEIGEEICGIAFTKISGKEIEIKRLITSVPDIESAVLKSISIAFPQHHIALIKDLEDIIEYDTGRQLWSPFYAHNNNNDAEYEDVAVIEEPFNETLNAYSFGMVKILDVKSLLSKIGFNEFEELKDFSEKEIRQIVLRKPVVTHANELEKILNLPEINFNMSLLLE